MRLQIKVEGLTIEQARALIIHLDSRLDGALEVNNKLVLVLGNLAGAADPETGNEIRQYLNEWSSVLNAMSEASEVEMRRILEINQPHASTLQ